MPMARPHGHTPVKAGGWVDPGVRTAELDPERACVLARSYRVLDFVSVSFEFRFRA